MSLLRLVTTIGILAVAFLLIMLPTFWIWTFIRGLREGYAGKQIDPGNSSEASKMPLENSSMKGEAVNQTIMSDPLDSPWDQQSLQLLGSLPRRSGATTALLGLLKLAAVPFLAIGGIGTGSTYALWYKTGDYKVGVGLALALPILVIGGAFWAVSERYTFQKAPLGDLMQAVLGGILHGKDVSRIQKAAAGVRSEASKSASASAAVLFAKAVATEVLAETSSTPDDKETNAKRAIRLLYRARIRGVETPLLWFLLATACRIAGQNEEAISHYETYLELRPKDAQARKLMESLKADASHAPQLGDSRPVPARTRRVFEALVAGDANMLTELLSDQDPKVQTAAREALATLGVSTKQP